MSECLDWNGLECSTFHRLELKPSHVFGCITNKHYSSVPNINADDIWSQMGGGLLSDTRMSTSCIWLLAWSACAPDVPLNKLSVREYLKTKVLYNILIQYVHELRERPIDLYNGFNLEFIIKSISLFQNHSAHCMEWNGDHFEYLL